MRKDENDKGGLIKRDQRTHLGGSLSEWEEMGHAGVYPALTMLPALS